MQHLGFRSVFAKLFASVMLALILFAVAMVLLTQLVHDKDSSIRSEVLATQILGQIDPFLQELNVSIGKENRLQSRFMLAVVKKSFDIFDESLQAKMGLYDNEGNLLMQTDNSDLPLQLPATPSILSRVFPFFSDVPLTQQAQVYSSTGYTLLYESRIVPKKPPFSAALNLFTGTLLLLLIMAGVLWWIARSMTWRINQMNQQMSQLGDGDFTARVNVRGNDEITLLARGFNQAAQKIEHLIDANSLLLAHASHELRTPITRIRLQIEMMDMLAGTMPTATKAKFDKRAQAINRDLSGLNDLVESILLVSRLDAGHAMQQIERLDLYDLINQERQHYPQATLIGEHIVIDGQPPMLTHLIRNLLTNAMLHGEPPVTVLLYGVQNINDAGIIPDYLLQSVLCSSFIDYNSSDYSHYDEQLVDNALSIVGKDIVAAEDQHLNLQPIERSKTTSAAKSDVAKPIVVLSAPIIYHNGETLVIEDPVIEDPAGNHFFNDVNTAEAESDVAADKQTTETMELSASPITMLSDTVETSSIGNYSKFTTDFSGKLKKMIWNIVPNVKEHPPSEDRDLVNTMSAQHKNIDNNKTAKKNNTKADVKNTIKNNDDTSITPRKESLFKKHLKKSKTEPARPLPKYAVFAVIDEGEGIPEDKRKEIFSPFVRLQQKKKGSGLGLSLVSQIVTAHQGYISTDTVNGYTRFLVVLPVKHDPHYNYKDRNSRNQNAKVV